MPLLDLLVEKRNDTKFVAVVLGTSQSLRRVFKKLLTDGDLHFTNSKQTSKDPQAQMKAKYTKWLRGLYTRYTNIMLCLIHHSDIRLQAAALHSLMDCVKNEWLTTGTETSFVSTLFEKVLLMILSCVSLTEVTFTAFLDAFLTKYIDVRYYALLSCKKLAESDVETLQQRMKKIFEVLGESEGASESDKLGGTFTRNSAEILLRLKIMDGDGAQGMSWFALKGDSSKAKGQFSLQKQKLHLNGCWMACLSRGKCPVDVYKIVLTHMHKHIMPGLTEPLLLSDFLTDAFNTGGVVSVLALDG